MEWISIVPPIAAIIVAVWTRNVFFALGLAILMAETFVAGFNPAMGVLNSIDRATGVFQSGYNTRILLFCLIIGATIVYMSKSGGISAMVEKLQKSGFASTPRRAGLVTAICGVLIFVETNISLLTTGVLGRPLFDKLGVSRERLAYIIDSTCSPISILVLFNGWGAFLLVQLNNAGTEAPVSVLMQTIALNFYPILTIVFVFLTIGLNRTFGPMAAIESGKVASKSVASGGAFNEAPEPPSRAIYMGVPLLIMIGGTLGFMAWTGGWSISEALRLCLEQRSPLPFFRTLLMAMQEGSGSQAILWSVILATAAGFIFLIISGRAKGEAINLGFEGMGKLLPAVTVIFLALVLGDSLKALGTGPFIAGMAAAFPAPWAIPAILFVAAGFTSFTSGTSWGTYGILIPVAVPLAVGAGVPVPLAVAAVMGGGVFGDHCSPISDTTIIASLAAGCDHIEHVKTQMPYALVAGLLATLMYLVAGAAS